MVSTIPRKERIAAQCSLTSSRRTDEDHSDLLGGGRSSKSSLLELLDAQVEGAQDILQLLNFVLNETHGCDSEVVWRLSVLETAIGTGRGRARW